MACQAITPSLRCCRNWSMLDSQFCHAHQGITPGQMKKRWFNKYVLGFDGTGPFFFGYSKTMGQKIQSDLASGLVSLEPRDIDLIPAQDRYIDIFVLLCSIGVATPQMNKRLYIKALHYFFRTSGPRFLYDLLINEKIQEHLILKNTETLEQFLLHLPLVYKLQSHLFLLNQNLLPNMIDFVNSILESETMKAYSWVPHRQMILDAVVKELGPTHSMTTYYDSRLLPDLQEIYNTEKQIQKVKMFCIQEDLMAKTWHPDRFQEWCLDEEEKKEETELM